MIRSSNFSCHDEINCFEVRPCSAARTASHLGEIGKKIPFSKLHTQFKTGNVMHFYTLSSHRSHWVDLQGCILVLAQDSDGEGSEQSKWFRALRLFIGYGNMVVELLQAVCSYQRQTVNLHRFRMISHRFAIAVRFIYYIPYLSRYVQIDSMF
jgi:hypothetical protein